MNYNAYNISTRLNKTPINFNKHKQKKEATVNIINNNQEDSRNSLKETHEYHNKSFSMKTKIIQNMKTNKIMIKRTIYWKENDVKKKRIELQEFNID